MPASTPLDDTLFAVLSTAIDAAVAMDESGAILAWNEAAERTFGWSAQEAIGKRVEDLVVPPEAREKHSSGLQRYLRTGVSKFLGKHIEVVAMDRSGRRFPVELSTTAASLGGTRLFLGFIRDISERNAREFEVADVTKRLTLAVRAHSIGIFDTDVPAGRVKFNDELCGIFGYKKCTVEMKLDAWRALVFPRDLAKIDRIFSSAIAARTVEVSYHYRIARCDGVTRYLEASALFFYDDTGNNIRRVGVNIDVTHRKNLERELSNSQSELAHLSRLNSLGAMASTLSHELNQPLTAVVNYLSAAKVVLAHSFEVPEDSLSKAIENALANATRAGEIIRRLRELSLKRPVIKQEITLTEILSETIHLILETDIQALVDVDLKIDPEADGLYSDPTLLQQVLFNLMRNSVQAMSIAGGRITIRSKPYKTHQVLVEVGDTGPGLPLEISTSLFTAFRTTKSDGMGVGLSVSRTIIESLGGKIWAESSPNGTTFLFTVDRSGKTAPRG